MTESEREAAYERWSRLPFPKGSVIDAIDEIHADLALVDSWVADAVVPIVKHNETTVATSVAPIRETLDDLSGRTRQLVGIYPGGAEASALKLYSVYIDALSEVYRTFFVR